MGFVDGALQGKYGVISSSSAFNYAYDVVNQENLGMDILKLGLSYPVPKELIADFCNNLEGIFVVEEVDPILEKEVLAIVGEYNLDIPVYGKFDETFPMVHEFNCDIVKIGFNKVFGYYIEVTKANLPLIKDEFGYERKQTLANAERFITPELKEKEGKKA